MSDIGMQPNTGLKIGTDSQDAQKIVSNQGQNTKNTDSQQQQIKGNVKKIENTTGITQSTLFFAFSYYLFISKFFNLAHQYLSRKLKKKV